MYRNSTLLSAALIPVLLGLLVAACGNNGGRTREVGVDDLWAVCVVPVDPGATSLEVGSEVQVQVQMGTCLSSSCDSLVGSTCTIERDGNNVTVTAEATIESRVRGACTSDCGLVQDTCGTFELDGSGDWTVTGNGAETTFSAPGEIPDCELF